MVLKINVFLIISCLTISSFAQKTKVSGIVIDEVNGEALPFVNLLFKGTKIGTDLLLTSNLALEAAYDDKDKKGLEDEWYAKIQFVHPPRNNGPTVMDGVSQVAWKENKDMSGELLSKVERNNKIMIEFKGSATISRTD